VIVVGDISLQGLSLSGKKGGRRCRNLPLSLFRSLWIGEGVKNITRLHSCLHESTPTLEREGRGKGRLCLQMGARGMERDVFCRAEGYNCVLPGWAL